MGTTVAITNSRINELNQEIAEVTTNIKAYELENTALKDDTIEFQYTIEQLNYSKDSLNQRINKLRKELNIKDKDIQKLQYIVSENQEKDSIEKTIEQNKRLLSDAGRWLFQYLGIHSEYVTCAD